MFDKVPPPVEHSYILMAMFIFVFASQINAFASVVHYIIIFVLKVTEGLILCLVVISLAFKSLFLFEKRERETCEGAICQGA